jgi:sugar lactone lactonase YvrE
MKMPWWGVSSCTTHIQVLESKTFLGKHGLRTIFSIECIDGKSIVNHSYYQNKEREIVLMPGSYFEVIGLLTPAPNLHIIQLKEILPSTPKENVSCFKGKQTGITIAGGNGQGNQLNQLSHPYGICIADDQTIYIADCDNNRIVQWKSNAISGKTVAGGNGEGCQLNQLNSPLDVIIDKQTNSLIIADYGNRRVIRWSHERERHGEILIFDIACCGLAMDKNGSLYVCDWRKNEVKRWKKEGMYGEIVAGGNGKGDLPNQLNCPSYIFVDNDCSLYVSDSGNNRVMKWIKDATEGIVVAGGDSPEGIAVDQLGRIYVTDYRNHRVMCWYPGTKEGTMIIGESGKGQQSNQLNGPRGLSFDKKGNLYVADFENHRIQKFKTT